MVLADWPRVHYQPGGGDPFLFYAVFGEVTQPLDLPVSKYRSSGPGNGLVISHYDCERNADIFQDLLEDQFVKTLSYSEPGLADVLRAQRQCILLQGDVPDPPDLNDFRDTIGLLTCMLDQGGVALLDAQMLKCWSPAEWRETVFESGECEPHRHVVVLVSEEDNGQQWFHTRGMRKFGRPDISVRQVPPECSRPAIELCNRFIELQALGGIVPEGQSIRMASLPPGMVCRHKGSVEDADFNNVHIEMVWPAP